MDITSIYFLFFVAINLLIYWNLPQKYQWVLLLLDSIVFYVLNAEPSTLVYLVISIVTVYFSTQQFVYIEKNMNNEKGARIKKVILILALIINLGILSVLKYTNLAIHTWNIIGQTNIADVNWVASLAISFYTLQITSYLLECYWGIIKPQNNILKLSLFTGYFPQMISGPISKYSEISENLFGGQKFHYTRVTNGMKRIAWGLLKKMAISNRMGIMVDHLWNHPDVYYGIWIWIAVVGYVIQLYTDFSGCMDIIIGTSECFGITLPENFNAPLFSRNIQEFWQRWHITLGRWLKEYIMNPLLKSKLMMDIGSWSKAKFGKKKGKRLPVYMSMLVLWLTMGLWHGNSWKYIIGEGFWFWLVIVAGQVLAEPLKEIKSKLKIKDGLCWTMFQVLRTNCIFVVGMLFFRADSFTDACLRIKNTFPLNISLKMIIKTAIDTAEPVGKIGCLIMLFSLLLVMIYDYYTYKGTNVIKKVSQMNVVLRWLIYSAVILCVIFSYNVDAQGFAYAQF